MPINRGYVYDSVWWCVFIDVHLQQVNVVRVQPLEGLVHGLHYVLFSHPRTFSAISEVRQMVAPSGDLPKHMIINTPLGGQRTKTEKQKIKKKTADKRNIKIKD